MVTPVSGTSAAIRSPVIRASTDDLTKQPDSRGKDEVHPAVPTEELSVSISAQASRQSQQLTASQSANDAKANADAVSKDGSKPTSAAAQSESAQGSARSAAPPAADAGAKVEAKTESISAANSGTNSTVVLDISYAAADADQNGVVSFAEQHAYELKHPEKLVAQNSEPPLSRNSSEAVKAYETVSGAGTET